MPLNIEGARIFIATRDVLLGEHWSNDSGEIAKVMVDYANQCIAEMIQINPAENCRHCVNESCVARLEKCEYQPRYVPIMEKNGD